MTDPRPEARRAARRLRRLGWLIEDTETDVDDLRVAQVIREECFPLIEGDPTWELRERLRDLCGRCHKNPCTVCQACIDLERLARELAELRGDGVCPECGAHWGDCDRNRQVHGVHLRRPHD